MPNRRPAVSVIIPAYNAGHTLARTLPVLGRPGRRDFELIVVDDASTDRTSALAEKFADRVIRLNLRRGPAEARNAGARASRGDLLFFIDADVRVTPQAAALVVRVFRRNPRWDAIFGSSDDRPAETNFLSQFKNLFHHYVHQNGEENASTFWAGCGAVRKKAFAEVGGFSGTYAAPSIEDVELGYRLREKGKTIRLLKELQATHLKRWTFCRLVRSDIFGRAIPWTKLAWTRGLPRDLNFRPVDRLSGILVWLLPVGLAAAALRLAWAGLAAGAAIFLVIINRPLYRFFLKKRGWRFAAGAVLWHWFYLLYSSAVFALWTPASLFRKIFRRKKAHN